MIGTDWLRRKAAEAVRIGEPTEEQAPDQQDDEAEPTLAERVLRRLREDAAARAADVLDCPCAVIYERCYCGR